MVYLNHLFGELDTMVVQFQTAPAEKLASVKSFRAEVGEKLGDLMYAEGNFVFASQCYRAVLDSMPQHTKAGSRYNTINSTKDELYRQVNLALGENNFALCKHRIAELKKKFTGDPETDEFARKIEQKVQNVAISKEYVQQLINENMWYTLSHVCEGVNQASYTKFLAEAKRRLDLMDKNINVIRQNLRRGKFAQVTQQLKQIKIVADYPAYDALLQEVKQFRRQVYDLNAEFKDLIEKKQWIRGENRLRQFLAENPKYRQGLAGYAHVFASGVALFQNGLRFWLFSIFGCILFMMISGFAYSFYNNYGGNIIIRDSASAIELVLTIGIWFSLMLLQLNAKFGLVRLLYAVTKTPPKQGGFGIIGTTILFALASTAACLAFFPDNVEIIANRIVSPDSPTTEKNVVMVLIIVLAWFGFFYLLHVYVFSFFNRCVGDKWEQPIFLPLLSILIFTALLLFLSQKVEVPGSFLLGLIAVFWWTMNAGIAYVRFRRLGEISTISRADITDYLQRNSLLQQYKDTDLGQPLLETDWYQQALTLAQQQDSVQAKNNP